MTRQRRRVFAENPDIDTKTKKRLIDLSEQILSGLDRGLQLQVLDPEKLPKLVKKNRPLLNQVRRKNEEFEDMIKKAEALRDQLKQQFKPENGDTSAVKVSSKGSEASEGLGASEGAGPSNNVN
ncbi:hypothetical protein HPB50_003957 [Hyalomma asiaticum]|uniref:Uncharacterized protein n=1 Tax=Hyalomma asiaticum TaxID=266040 RepID=A0ACB7RJX7_HYAAI|nr:hypothetical protein HPB50_003957 [Hyalomma asiaticum]